MPIHIAEEPVKVSSDNLCSEFCLFTLKKMANSMFFSLFKF